MRKVLEEEGKAENVSTTSPDNKRRINSLSLTAYRLQVEDVTRCSKFGRYGLTRR
jgi:hypothetical protein